MTDPSIGVAVIGAGMAGRAHAAGYRSASTLYGEGLPEVRLAAIADVNPAFAADTARRFGYERAESGWEAVAAADDIDVVSVVVANPLHRPIVEGLLAAGKHVLCEKPMAPSVEDAEAMVAAADASGRETGIGFVFRRSPAISAIREQLSSGGIGRPLHFNGHYWCDYAVDPHGPMSWRYKGGPGSGALSDIGSHLIDLGEFVCGPIQSVRGAVLSTFVTERALPLGAAVGHAAAEVSDVTEPVENEDLVTFTASFASGATGTFSASRAAYGLANSLGFELFASSGAATFDLARAGEFGFVDGTPAGPRATGRCWWGRPTPMSPGGSRWTSPGSVTGRTTCSPSRPGPSWSRSRAWRGSRAWPRSPTACTTSACWTRSSPRPRPAAPTSPSTEGEDGPT
jgi:predicted dehydrogenase